MKNIDIVLEKIFEKCQQMTPEELDRTIEASLATPFGRMLKEMNDETLEAIALIEQEEKRIEQ